MRPDDIPGGGVMPPSPALRGPAFRRDGPHPEMTAWDPDADHRRMSPAWARHIPTGSARRRIDWLNVFVWFVLVPLGSIGGWGLILWLVL